MLRSEMTTSYNPIPAYEAFPHTSLNASATTTFMDPSTVSPMYDMTMCNSLYEQRHNTPGFSGHVGTESSRMYDIPQHSFPTSSQYNYRYHSPHQDYYKIGQNTLLNTPSTSTYYSPQSSFAFHSIPQSIPNEHSLSLSFDQPYTTIPSTLSRDTQQNAEPILQSTPELRTDIQQNVETVAPQQLWDSAHFGQSNFLYMNKHDSFNRKCKKCPCPSCEGIVAPQFSADGKRLHLCHIVGCYKIYTKTSHLKAHLRCHVGDRPYTCDWCNKNFTRSDDLKRHVRTHTGEKKYKCLQCDMKFTRKDHLNKHAKTHIKRKNKQNAKAKSDRKRMCTASLNYDTFENIL